MRLSTSQLQAYLVLVSVASSSIHYFANGFITSSSSSPVFLSKFVRNCQTTSTSTATISRNTILSTKRETIAFLRAVNDEYNHDEDENDDTDDAIDFSISSSPEALEKARQNFEQLMAIPNDDTEHKTQEQELHSLSDSTSSSSDKTDDRLSIITKTFPKSIFLNRKAPPPLTTVLRERRLQEIELIKELANSNKSMDELWRLWITERGTEAASRLLRAEELISVESWSEAESIILSLIEEHGIYWAEPVNRLATLYYMLGRYQESKALCELVLEIKPWHFGALSGIVMVCTAMNDASGARYWVENRLPPLGERRMLWTEKALVCANDSLREALEVARSADMQNKDREFRHVRAQLEMTMGLSSHDKDQGKIRDAWQ
jgi:tetratricopeptide (TPR) repeat protein